MGALAERRDEVEEAVTRSLFFLLALAPVSSASAQQYPTKPVRFIAPFGIEPVTSTPQHFAELIKTETGKYARVISESGIKID